MSRITVSYFLLLMALCTSACVSASAATATRGKYTNHKLGYEVQLPPGTVCMAAEPDHGCGFNISLRFAESELKPDALPPRYIWVYGERNTGTENTLERAVQRAVNVATTGRAGVLILGRRSFMSTGLPGVEFEVSYNAEDGEALEKIVILYRERKGMPNVIYTFGLQTPRRFEKDDVRLFHEFVSGFRVK